MSSIFSKIVKGEIPSVKVAENEFAFAFMDIFPLRKGHVLVVPKMEVDEIYNLPEKDYIELTKFAKQLASAMRKAFNMRIGMSVIGLEIPHAHIHLIPIETANDINFNQEKQKVNTDELQKIADNIKLHIICES
jgi:histidine triad (HIT) family protein